MFYKLLASNVWPFAPPRPVFSDGAGPSTLGEAYRGVSNKKDGPEGQWNYLDRIQQQQQRVEDAEDLDVNAQIHGNWTIENAKSKLHQFLQSEKIHADYKYTPVGPDHTRYSHIIHTNGMDIYMYLLFMLDIKQKWWRIMYNGLNVSLNMILSSKIDNVFNLLRKEK